MQQYQIYQERKPRFKAMQFNGIGDIDALFAMSRAKAFELLMDDDGLSLKLSLAQGPVFMTPSQYLVIDENSVSTVLDPETFYSGYELERGVVPWNGPAGQPVAIMAPPPAAPYPPMPTAPRTPR